MNIPRMVAELRSEIELIDVAIRALERVDKCNWNRRICPNADEQESKPVGRNVESLDPKAGVDGIVFRKAQGVDVPMNDRPAIH